MRLPGDWYGYTIPPETEYDALFRMPSLKLARIFHRLSKKRTRTVLISIKDNQGVRFIKERVGDSSSADEDEDVVDRFQVNPDDIQPEEATTVVMEDRIKEGGIEKALCMVCLHDCINRNTKIAQEFTQDSPLHD